MLQHGQFGILWLLISQPTYNFLSGLAYQQPKNANLPMSQHVFYPSLIIKNMISDSENKEGKVKSWTHHLLSETGLYHAARMSGFKLQNISFIKKMRQLLRNRIIFLLV